MDCEAQLAKQLRNHFLRWLKTQ